MVAVAIPQTTDLSAKYAPVSRTLYRVDFETTDTNGTARTRCLVFDVESLDQAKGRAIRSANEAKGGLPCIKILPSSGWDGDVLKVAYNHPVRMVGAGDYSAPEYREARYTITSRVEQSAPHVLITCAGRLGLGPMTEVACGFVTCDYSSTVDSLGLAQGMVLHCADRAIQNDEGVTIHARIAIDGETVSVRFSEPVSAARLMHRTAYVGVETALVDYVEYRIDLHQDEEDPDGDRAQAIIDHKWPYGAPSVEAKFGVLRAVKGGAL